MGWPDHLPGRQEDAARDAATEALLRGRTAHLSDRELHATIAGAWRRIEERRLGGRQVESRPHEWSGLGRLLVPALALGCFLLGLLIGMSWHPAGYEFVLNDLASHPMTELAP